MKIVIQKVTKAQVTVEEKVIGKIDKGFLVLLGVTHGDTKKEADYLVKKLCNMRIFEDENQKMNLDLKEVGGQLLVVSQFTLYANCEKGNRPSFIEAADPIIAQELYEYFMEECKKQEFIVEHGKFGAYMEVSLVNDGPTTIVLEKLNKESVHTNNE